MAKAMDVAHYLIYLRNEDCNTNYIHTYEYFSLCNLKLQKLLYFCQLAHYKWDNEMLITDEYFELWEYGATISKIYNKFNYFGQSDIYINEDKLDKNIRNIKLSDDEKETIKAIWNQMRREHPFTLVKSINDDYAHEVARDNNLTYIDNLDIKKTGDADHEAE